MDSLCEQLFALEAQEAVLQLGAYNEDVAIELGLCAQRLAHSFDRGVAIQIVRAKDGLVQFAFAQDSKAPRNYGFCEMKRVATEKYLHSSLWVRRAAELGQIDDQKMREMTGGAFPLFVGADLVATISISGLHNGEDHVLAVQSLVSYLKLKMGKDVVEIPGPLI